MSKQGTKIGGVNREIVRNIHNAELLQFLRNKPVACRARRISTARR